MRTIGTVIRQARLARGLSLKAFADAILPRTSHQFVSNIERGLCPLPADKIPGAAEILSIREDVLIDALVEDYRARIEVEVENVRAAASRRPDPSELK